MMRWSATRRCTIDAGLGGGLAPDGAGLDGMRGKGGRETCRPWGLTGVGWGWAWGAGVVGKGVGRGGWGPGCGWGWGGGGSGGSAAL